MSFVCCLGGQGKGRAARRGNRRCPGLASGGVQRCCRWPAYMCRACISVFSGACVHRHDHGMDACHSCCRRQCSVSTRTIAVLPTSIALRASASFMYLWLPLSLPSKGSTIALSQALCSHFSSVGFAYATIFDIQCSGQVPAVSPHSCAFLSSGL